MSSHPGSGGREGMALLLALGVMVALSIIATVLVSSFHQSLDRANDRETEIQALYIAEAGIELALYQLQKGSGFSSGGSEVPFGSGAFSVVVTPASEGRFLVESTGSAHADSSIRATVSVEAEISHGGAVRVLRWQEAYS
ncbi:MAG: hypothetical protein AMXMBFR82_04550 [Candidatus Hydrogenedentota bacterium]